MEKPPAKQTRFLDPFGRPAETELYLERDYFLKPENGKIRELTVQQGDPTYCLPEQYQKTWSKPQPKYNIGWLDWLYELRYKPSILIWAVYFVFSPLPEWLAPTSTDDSEQGKSQVKVDTTNPSHVGRKENPNKWMFWKDEKVKTGFNVAARWLLASTIMVILVWFRFIFSFWLLL